MKILCITLSIFLIFTISSGASESIISIVPAPSQPDPAIHIKDQISKLEKILIKDNPNTFAGLFLINDLPPYNFVTLFSGKPKYPISHYIDHAIAQSAEVRYVEASLADLWKMRTDVENALTKAGINFASDILIMDNRAEIYVHSGDYIESVKLVKKIKLKFPQRLVLLDSGNPQS